VTGNNHDDHHYRGSRAKYESRGFLLGGYQHLAPLQARLLLALRLSAGGGGGGGGGGPDAP
jgi:L-asparaginase